MVLRPGFETRRSKQRYRKKSMQSGSKCTKWSLAMPRFAALESVDPKWAWAAYEPSAETPWNLDRAAHLYRRAAFGGTWAELQAALTAGPQGTLEKLVSAGGEEKVATFYTQVDGMA